MSPYYTYSNLKKYYAGFGGYFVSKNGQIIDILENKSLTMEKTAQLAQSTNELLTRTLNSADKTVSKNDRWVKNDRYMQNASYFENLTTSVIDCDVDYCYISKDVGYEANIATSCGIVALEIVMQYYSRNKIAKTIPLSFVNSVSLRLDGGKSTPTGKDQPDYYFEPYKFNYLSRHLHHYLDQIAPHGALGENDINAIGAGMQKFYTTYPPNAEKGEKRLLGFINNFYAGIVNCIDSGNPAILETGLWGNGYYEDGGVWKKKSVNLHQMVVYGYCTNNSGQNVEDFIVHGGWDARYTKMYVYKTNAHRNMVFSLM